MHRFLAALTLAAAPLAAPALTLVQSQFDGGAEGWTAANGAGTREWLSAGGVSGGFVRATDDTPYQIWAFVAPEAYRGDQSAAIGGRLSWWLQVSTLAVPMTVPYADLKIGGTDGRVLAAEAGPSPGLDWTRYEVAFVPGAWRLGDWDGPLASAADIAAVMSSVEFLHIRGEFSGWVDTGALDAVVLSAVPELPTAALAVAGLALLARRRRAPD